MADLEKRAQKQIKKAADTIAVVAALLWEIGVVKEASGPFCGLVAGFRLRSIFQIEHMEVAGLTSSISIHKEMS